MRQATTTEGWPGAHETRVTRAAAWAAIGAVTLALSACAHQTRPVSTPQVTVYFCRAGTDTLVPTAFSSSGTLSGAALESALIAQLIAGPAADSSAVVEFPAGTSARVAVEADQVTVDLRGPIATAFHGGASDEVALFKALTYTATSVDGIDRVQVLVAGRKVPTLPGGEFEIDEPLTRGTFTQ